jgi:hypothetical protein
MKIRLELSENKPRNISYHSYGDFTFEQDNLSFSNKAKRVQGCMLLISLPELFDRLVRTNRGEIRKFVFEPQDCSYELLFERRKDQLVISEFSRQKMTCGIHEFAEELYQAVREMFIRNDLEISELGSGREDFLKSWIEFKAEFSFSDPEKDPENGWA